ncbi:MAG: PIG-L family deacetylase [Pseudonocardiales bacterium]|nr:PIG-L family deacetylase [Pseudonocardiales bacterium]
MKVLAVGAHPDDIELGCGGALLMHAARGDEITMLVLTTGEQGPHHQRSRLAEQHDAAAMLTQCIPWPSRCWDRGRCPGAARVRASLTPPPAPASTTPRPY